MANEPPPAPTVQGIHRARSAVDPAFRDSPVVPLEVGGRVVTAKLETFNPIRSFKGRGASWFVRQLGGEPAHLVCASAGNFGQGIAACAVPAGHRVTVVVSRRATPVKVERMRSLGARIVVAGDTFDEAREAAEGLAAEWQARFVVDGVEPAVTEGAGTVGVELLEARPGLDRVVVPVGNGALITGVGLWLRARAPQAEVVGVCAEGAPAMRDSFVAGRVVEGGVPSTIADGIAVRRPDPPALDLMARTVDRVVLVDDETILRAMRLLLHQVGIVAEPAGAAAVAALLAEPELATPEAAVVICGGNVDPALLQRIASLGWPATDRGDRPVAVS